MNFIRVVIGLDKFLSVTKLSLMFHGIELGHRFANDSVFNLATAKRNFLYKLAQIFSDITYLSVLCGQAGGNGNANSAKHRSTKNLELNKYLLALEVCGESSWKHHCFSSWQMFSSRVHSNNALSS